MSVIFVLSNVLAGLRFAMLRVVPRFRQIKYTLATCGFVRETIFSSSSHFVTDN